MTFSGTLQSRAKNMYYTIFLYIRAREECTNIKEVLRIFWYISFLYFFRVLGVSSCNHLKSVPLLVTRIIHQKDLDDLSI